ncbi:right-handed parallel beta-helix repeat-containing protein [Sphingobacterium sp. ML3W]|uniref:parallel beta-helix domain-containing protein n=1 Tax=Sphingobacterium sp. ML3W TaxID=1538644 RepID=UPI00249C2114|nr:parallel beta-helix domain-containing protein [Sphingobacterium sp. ML3W]WFA79854.1 right-handed parallel beta-helix repeat-containing protein [Sphingobacterium sp. ML3W]
MKRHVKNRLIMVFIGLVFWSCKNQQSTDYNVLTFGPGQEEAIEEAFLSIKDSTNIHLKAGKYRFDNLSIAQVNHIKIEGEGHDKTIVDFSGQTQGGEGIRITDVKGLTIGNMTIRDSKGDLLKINNSQDIIIADLHSIWSSADSTSGGYGIYPVLCKNVLIENCYAEGASDAGIYVGQTKGVVVRKCKAFKNVAGCEIENTTDAEVYDNEFYGNTAGFLIFDLPDLSQRGGHVKAYRNKIYDNNFRNFAKGGSFGTFWGVGNASPGSGIIILSTSNIEIYDNTIEKNNTSAITIASGFAVDEKAAERINANYSPIPTHIKIHGNTIKMEDKFPQPAYEHRIGQLIIATEAQLNAVEPNRSVKRIPAILYDGITSNIMTNGTSLNPDSICIDQPGENMFVSADFKHAGQADKWKPSSNVKPFQCK